MIRIGINGLGRIGRVVFRTCFERSNLQVAAINDPAIDAEYICYLLKFDSTHGTFRRHISFTKDEIIVNDKVIKVFHEKLPADIPWQAAGVHYVIEASGMFTTYEKASGHLVNEHIKRVFITAPSGDVPMIILGINDGCLQNEQKIVSCASSTLYCLAPIAKVLEDNFGVEEGFVTSIHAMTPSLKPLDGLCLRGKHWREHRSIHQNIIPATTGACKALGKIMPRMKDKLSGVAFRVPIVNVSVLDISIRLKRNTTLKEIVDKVEEASKTSFKKILKVSNENAVSSDFIRETHSCVLDVNSSLQLKSNFFKLVCWYENEYSYACRVIDSICFTESKMLLHSGLNITLNIPLNNQKTIDNFFHHSDSCKRNSAQYIALNFRSHSCAMISQKHILANITNNTLTENNNSQLVKKNQVTEITKDSTKFKTNSDQAMTSLMNNSITVLTNRDEIEFSEAQDRLELLKNEFFLIIEVVENLLKKSKTNNMKQSKLGLGEELTNTKPNQVQKTIKDSCEKLLSRDFGTDAVLHNTKQQINNENITKNTLNNTVLSKKDEIFDDALIQNEKEMSIKYQVNINEDPCKMKNPDNCINDGIIAANNILRNELQCHNDLTDKSFGENKEDLTTKERRDVYNTEVKVVISSTVIGNMDQNKMQIIKQIELNKYDVKKSVDDNVNYKTDSVKTDCIAIDLSSYRNSLESMQTSNLFAEPVVSDTGASLFSESTSKYGSVSNTNITISNFEEYKIKEDIYDKLHSASNTDSNNSLQISDRKSQVIDITDLTNSLEDLARLDKLCKVIEISDELSNKLFSTLKNDKQSKEVKWSFKDLCDRIKLDEFCDKIFGKSSV